jgi:hypothetical protein
MIELQRSRFFFAGKRGVKFYDTRVMDTSMCPLDTSQAFADWGSRNGQRTRTVDSDSRLGQQTRTADSDSGLG